VPKHAHNSETALGNPVIRFFSNPIVGVLGSIASILGVGLAVFFYFAQQQGRDLAVLVHPVRVPVVKSGQASQLSVKFDGSDITTDVTAAQVALWNRGRLPIRSENVLRPVRLTTPGCTILEATLRKQNRDVVGMGLDTSALAEGIVGISWNILEENDGGVIQIIYAGNGSVPIVLQGIIEGQRDLSRAHYYSGAVREPEEQMRSERHAGLLMGWVQIGAAIVTCVLAILSYIRGGAVRKARWVLAGFILLMSIYLSAGLFILLYVSSGGPPFGF
jgi:hypothetical protein